MWLDRPWLKTKGELRSVTSKFSRTHSVIPLFIELQGFKGSQKLKKSDEMALENKILYIYSANGDPQWFQETQVIPIIGQVCYQDNKMLRNKMLRMHLRIQESKWNRRNLILNDFPKEWCDPSVSVTTHPPWEAISTDSKWPGRSRWNISNIEFLSEHLLDLTKRKLSLGKK